MSGKKTTTVTDLGYLIRSGERLMASTTGAVTLEQMQEWTDKVLASVPDAVASEIRECIAARPSTGGTQANCAVVGMCLDVLRAQ